MRFRKYIRAAAVAAILSLCAAPAFAQSLTTHFSRNATSQNGNIFDLKPKANLTVNSFDINMETFRSSSSNGTIEVYWRVGTSQGFESNPAGWNLLGSAAVAGQPHGTPTAVPIGGLTLAAGQTYGIYIHFVEPDRYLSYGSGGPTTYSNNELELTSYYAKELGAPLLSGPTFYPREWNGTVHYTVAKPLTTCASEGYTGTKLTWCKNICENGLTGATLDMWIHRWINRYRDLPYCAQEGGGEEEPPPQEL